MKKKIKSTFSQGREIAVEVVSMLNASHILESPNVREEDKHQAATQIHATIANGLYHAVEAALEQERLLTLVKLSRTLNDKQLTKTIEALGYRLTVETPKANVQ